MLKKPNFTNVKRIFQQLAEIDQTLTEDDLNRETSKLLKILGETASADRAYLFQYFTEPAPCYHYIFEWCAEGVSAQLENCKLVRAVELPRWHARLVNKKSIIIHNLEEIKAVMPEEYAWLKPQRIKSLLVVPIYNKKRLWGFLGMDNPEVACIQEFKYLLSSIGGHLGSLKENYRMLRLLDNKRQHLENNVEALQKDQRKLAKTAEDAQQANAAKSIFLSRMSHDIRTPMNAICGLVEIALKHMEDKQKVEDCLLKVQDASKNLQSLANDVLDLAQIEKGELLIRPQNITVQSILDALRSNVQSYLHVHPLTFSLDKHNILHEHIVADPVRLNQIYLNLLSNAFKYTRSGGSVRMELYQEELPQADKVRLIAVFQDTGIGMSKEYMKNMYNAFSRAIDTRINEVRGSGLGLAIVKRVVELMHGSIKVESELNVGTTFHVELELSYVEEDRLSAQRDAELDYAIFKGKHILIAEDNKLSYEIESEVLEMYGITCSHAENGEQCVQLFESAEAGTFDAILMDMQMPVLNGVEATRRIRWSLHPDAQRIPIIAMTANAFSTDIALCLEAGMDEHLAKPFNVMLLLKVLTRYLQ